MRALNKVKRVPEKKYLVFAKKSLKNKHKSQRRNNWCLQKIIRKLTDDSFTMIDLVTASFGNRSLFTQMKENDPLINHFGPMYINFYGYPTYSGALSEIFENDINTRIQFAHGYPHSKIKFNMLI